MFKSKKSRPEVQIQERTYSSSEVAQVAAVSPHEVRFNLIAEIYFPAEVIEITVIAELRRKGFSLQKIRRVLRFLQKEMGRRLAEVMQASSDLHLVTDGKSIYLEDQHERIIDILKNARQPMFLVCVTDQARRLSEIERKPARMEAGVAARRSRLG